jgi:hypothetical protein
MSVVFELIPKDLNHILHARTQLSALHIQYLFISFYEGGTVLPLLYAALISLSSQIFQTLEA